MHWKAFCRADIIWSVWVCDSGPFMASLSSSRSSSSVKVARGWRLACELLICDLDRNCSSEVTSSREEVKFMTVISDEIKVDIYNTVGARWTPQLSSRSSCWASRVHCNPFRSGQVLHADPLHEGRVLRSVQCHRGRRVCFQIGQSR